MLRKSGPPSTSSQLVHDQCIYTVQCIGLDLGLYHVGYNYRGRPTGGGGGEGGGTGHNPYKHCIMMGGGGYRGLMGFFVFYQYPFQQMMQKKL